MMSIANMEKEARATVKLAKARLPDPSEAHPIALVEARYHLGEIMYAEGNSTHHKSRGRAHVAKMWKEIASGHLKLVQFYCNKVLFRKSEAQAERIVYDSSVQENNTGD